MNCKLARNFEFLLKRVFVSFVLFHKFSFFFLLSYLHLATKKIRSSFATRLSISVFHLAAIKPPLFGSHLRIPLRFSTIVVDHSVKTNTGRFGSINRRLDSRRFIADRQRDRYPYMVSQNFSLPLILFFSDGHRTTSSRSL